MKLRSLNDELYRASRKQGKVTKYKFVKKMSTNKRILLISLYILSNIILLSISSNNIKSLSWLAVICAIYIIVLTFYGVIIGLKKLFREIIRIHRSAKPLRIQRRFEKQVRNQDKIRAKQEKERLELKDSILDAQITGGINGTIPDYVKALKFKGITKFYLNLLGEDANKAFDKYFKEVGELKKNVDEAKGKLINAMSQDENFQKLIIDAIENLKKKKEGNN